MTIAKLIPLPPSVGIIALALRPHASLGDATRLIRRLPRALLALMLVLAFAAPAMAQTDPLPDWNAGAAKTAITSFVAAVTKQGGPDYVPPEARIATFDNDGTLWTEQPVYAQVQFAFDQIRTLAASNPKWKSAEPYASVIRGDMRGLLAQGTQGLERIMVKTHAGMTTDQYQDSVKAWLATAKNPKFGRPATALAYQPMLELLAYLRQNGFKTFIVTGGGIEFVRPWAEATYGIPPEQVIGSSGIVSFKVGADGKTEFIKQPTVEFLDDGVGKPIAINRFIGRRPILAFGNSDGDLQMLQYVAGGQGPHLVAFVHHDDAVREVAYDRTSKIGKLDKGLDAAATKGWLIVSMKNDWKTVFPGGS